MHVYNITFAVTEKRTPCSSEIRITDTNRDSAHAPKVDRPSACISSRITTVIHVADAPHPLQLNSEPHTNHQQRGTIYPARFSYKHKDRETHPPLQSACF